jgi:hypothetical protein
MYNCLGEFTEITYEMLFSTCFRKISRIAYENNLYENSLALYFVTKMVIHKQLYDKHA